MGALQGGDQDHFLSNYNHLSKNSEEKGKLCVNIIVGKGRLLAREVTVSSNYKINITLTVLVTAYLCHIHTQVVAQHYASFFSYYCSLHNSWHHLKSSVF